VKKYLTFGLAAAMLVAATPASSKDVDFLDVLAYMQLYKNRCGKKLSAMHLEYLESLETQYKLFDILERIGKIGESKLKKMGVKKFCAFTKKEYIDAYDP